jgi:hypothetical protein
VTRVARWYILNQKSHFGKILEGLGMEGVGKFYGHLVYFMAIWYILWPFGIFYGHLVYLFVIWCIFPVLVHMLYIEKSGNPDRDPVLSSACLKAFN